MKLNLCKLLGHRWVPVFISGEYKGIKVKFIGTYCSRCDKGHDELLNTVRSQTDITYGTYVEEYFDDLKYNREWVSNKAEELDHITHTLVHSSSQA